MYYLLWHRDYSAYTGGSYLAALWCRRTGKKPILSMEETLKVVTPFISKQKVSIPFERKHGKAMMLENKESKCINMNYLYFNGSLIA